MSDIAFALPTPPSSNAPARLSAPTFASAINPFASERESDMASQTISIDWFKWVVSALLGVITVGLGFYLNGFKSDINR